MKVWASLQFARVNVTAPETVAVSVAGLVAVTVTSPLGRFLSTTVYSLVAPTATRTLSRLTVTAGWSSSVMVRVTGVTVSEVAASVSTSVLSPSATPSGVISTTASASVSPSAMVNGAG